ncbi:MAG: co-chaperone GroES [Planctomycetota bacterium]
MKVRPLGDKILVQRVAAEEKTASGIFLPESAKEKPQQAKVLALGAGKVLDSGERAPFTVKEGDTVILGKWGGTEVKIDGEDFMVMSEDEVLAIVG